MISFKEFLEILSKWSPIKINIDKSTKIESLIINKNKLEVENGFITLGDKTKIKIQQDKTGKISFLKDGTEIKSSVGISKKDKIRLLDKEKEVYSRADVSENQFNFLSIEQKHEKIILEFKSLLKDYRRNLDLGSLLLASTIIELEEKGEANKNKIIELNKQLNQAYENVGRMIYNLFRSSILTSEILPHLRNLKKIYGEKAKEKFLVYWYDIIEGGYPTAYFIKHDDMFNKEVVFKQLNWRFDRGTEYVDVYSRGKFRNTITIKECSEYCDKNEKFSLDPGKPYKLGYTEAIKIRIKRKNN